MASPHADSFYCLDPKEFSNVQLDVYNSICIVSSVFGLIGAVHQIRTWRERVAEMRSNAASDNVSRRASVAAGSMSLRSGYDGFVNPHIVMGLAKADLAACIGKPRGDNGVSVDLDRTLCENVHFERAWHNGCRGGTMARTVA